MPTMLILRGIAGRFGGKQYPRGALDEKSALAYAKARGYTGKVLDVSGETGLHSRQTKMALSVYRANKNVEALYGFSGGGYNIFHMLTQLSMADKQRLKLVVVIGAPKRPASAFRGHWEVVYRKDPPAGHMAGPLALLEETERRSV